MAKCLYKFKRLFNKRRQFQIWNASRNIRKTCSVTDFDDLLKTARKKLCLDDTDIRVFLEETGSEIEETSVLKNLKKMTILIICESGQKWTESVCNKTDNSQVNYHISDSMNVQIGNNNSLRCPTSSFPS